jgi:hypothetical protein
MLAAILAEIGGQVVRCSSVIVAYKRCACAAVVLLIADVLTYAQWQGGAPKHGGPVYQRRAFEWSHGHGKRRDEKRRDDKFGHFPSIQSPQVNAGWFQRPYPYHLDYYRMRYGGSYAPYFGNLYGPPQVVTAPPYYGPYYGEYLYPNGGAYGTPMQSPMDVMPPHMNGAASESLPTPPQQQPTE